MEQFLLSKRCTHGKKSKVCFVFPLKVPSAAPPQFCTQPNPDFKSLTPASSPYLTPVIELI